MRQRYSTVAPAYTALSAEWPIYRVGRLKGIPLLELSEGTPSSTWVAAPD